MKLHFRWRSSYTPFIFCFPGMLEKLIKSGRVSEKMLKIIAVIQGIEIGNADFKVYAAIKTWEGYGWSRQPDQDEKGEISIGFFFLPADCKLSTEIKWCSYESGYYKESDFPDNAGEIEGFIKGKLRECFDEEIAELKKYEAMKKIVS